MTSTSSEIIMLSFFGVMCALTVLLYDVSFQDELTLIAGLLYLTFHIIVLHRIYNIKNILTKTNIKKITNALWVLVLIEYIYLILLFLNLNKTNNIIIIVFYFIFQGVILNSIHKLSYNDEFNEDEKINFINNIELIIVYMSGVLALVFIIYVYNKNLLIFISCVCYITAKFVLTRFMYSKLETPGLLQYNSV